MQLFRQSEDAVYIDLSFHQTLFAQRAGQPVLRHLDKLLCPRAVESAFSSRWRARRPIQTGRAAALRRAILHSARAAHISRAPQLLTGRTDVRVLRGQPGEALASPDILAQVTEAGGGNEGRDAESAEVEVV